MSLERSIIRDGRAYLIKVCRHCAGAKCGVCKFSGEEAPVPFQAQGDLTLAVPVSECSVAPMETFVKHNKAKPRIGLVGPRALMMLGEVMLVGANKYSEWNWAKPGVKYSDYLDATLRHLTQFNAGEDLDPETGLHHLSHAAASCMILLELVLLGKGEDDRYVP